MDSSRSKAKPALPQDCGTWPRRLRLALDAIASVFMQACWLTRSRAEGSRSQIIRLTAERDAALFRNALLERGLAVFRHRLGNMNPHRRPDVLPQDRFEVLQIIRMQGWSIQHAADRFVLHENTVGAWQRMFRGNEDAGGPFGPAPFSRIGDAVRWILVSRSALDRLRVIFVRLLHIRADHSRLGHYSEYTCG